MARYVELDALIAEMNKLKNISLEYGYTTEQRIVADVGKDLTLKGLLDYADTLEVKEVDLENYDKVKKLLSLSFMHFLDANRPVGKMCLSNGECFDIDKAFDKLDFAKLFRYMKKYLKAQKGEEV